MRKPLMPKATASWLIDNTSLSFKQISEFVGIHALEIQAIADGEVSSGILPRNPLENGELTQEEILKCEKNHKLSLNIKKIQRCQYQIQKQKDQDIHLYLREQISQMEFIGL